MVRTVQTAAIIAAFILAAIVPPSSGRLPTAHADVPPDLAPSLWHEGSFYVGSAHAYIPVFVQGVVGSGSVTGPVTMTITLPTGMTLRAVNYAGDTWACSGSTTVTCTNLQPLWSGSGDMFGRGVQLQVDIAAEAVGVRTISETVWTPGEVNLGNNTATDTVTVQTGLGPPDLTIFKQATVPFVAGGTGLFTFYVDNQSTTPETGTVTIADSLPSGMTYGGISAGTYGWACSGSTSVTCSRSGAWPSGTSYHLSLTIRVNIDASAAGPRTNIATVSAADDINTSNNTSSPVTVTVQQYTLTVTKAGSGAGTVTSQPAGITCGTDCTAVFTPGTLILLTATPSPGSTFTGWSGITGWSGTCGTTSTCMFTLTSTVSVTAIFQRTSTNPVSVRVVRSQVQPPGLPAIQATLSAAPACGPIERIQFGTPGQPFPNATVSVTGPSEGPAGQTSGFTYTPPAGTTSVTVTLQRVVQAGSATVSPIRFRDSCGEWTTFVGGGPDAFR